MRHYAVALLRCYGAACGWPLATHHKPTTANVQRTTTTTTYLTALPPPTYQPADLPLPTYLPTSFVTVTVSVSVSVTANHYCY